MTKHDSTPSKSPLQPLLASAAAVALAALLAILADSGSSGWFGLPLLAELALIAFAVQWLAFVPAYAAQTEHYYDLTGSLTYAGIVLLALSSVPLDGRTLLLATLVLIWCARLGSFLFRRVRRDGKDGRFDAIKPDWARFLMAWTLQGLWVFLTLFAALIAMTKPGTAALDVWAFAGAAVWTVGFALEVVADAQKSAFRRDPTNAGRYISSGLWAWSRHPNYFGEILLWSGICLIAVPSFAGWQWLGLISPIFVAALLCGVSGIPLLEARADEKWGGQPDYESYKARTPVLLPRPPRA